MVTFSNCKECDESLNDENRQGNYCKVCHRKRKLEQKKARLAKPIDIDSLYPCEQCGCQRQDKLHGVYCIACFNKRRAQGLRKDTPGTEKALVIDEKKQCSCCEDWLHVTCFKTNRNQCKFCETKKQHDYRSTLSGEKKEQQLQTKRNWEKAKKEKDIQYKLAANYRTRMWQVITGKKPKSSKKILGCDRDFFMKWLEYNFSESMTFENYGTYWHMDHIIPCNVFDLSTVYHIQQCFHWSNIAPMKGSENIIKYNHIDMTYITRMQERAKDFIQHMGLAEEKLVEPTILRSLGNN